MDNAVFFLLVFLVFFYMVARQFTEQRITLLSLLLLPLLSAYASYTDLQPAFARFAPLPLVGGLVGIATGIFRGRHTRVRLDSASGIVYSKPQLPSSLMWLALLIVRIGVTFLAYTPSLRHNLLVGVLIAFGGTVFLLSISIQKWIVYRQYSSYRAATA